MLRAWGRRTARPVRQWTMSKPRKQQPVKRPYTVLMPDEGRPEYLIENGLRYIVPYPYTFSSFAKGRWVNRQLLELMVDEFRAETAEYYAESIKQGRITMNGEKVTAQYIVKSGDLLEHRLHRHEPPVSAQSIKIVRQDDEVVVVDKPASMPVHPSGRYRHNSVKHILALEHGLNEIRTVHRLDRLTSGVLIFARTQEVAAKLFRQISGRDVRKHYVCRVRGVFPQEPIECNEPIKVMVHRLGLCGVHPEGKESSTRFTLLHTDGATSVVKCEPRTGRMHQIRVHLQFLGYPIVNDPIYASRVWSSCKGPIPHEMFEKAACLLAAIMTAPPMPPIRVDDMGNEIPSGPHDIGAQLPADLYGNEDNCKVSHEYQPLMSAESHKRQLQMADSDSISQKPKPKRIHRDDDADGEDGIVSDGDDANELDAALVEANREAAAKIAEHDVASALVARLPPISVVQRWQKETDPMCAECRVVRPDPPLAERLLFLHAWRYEGDGWAYETDMPEWADKAFKYDLQSLTCHDDDESVEIVEHAEQ